jgi:toxin-antitoxin system, toxin component, Txe/YoeB family
MSALKSFSFTKNAYKDYEAIKIRNPKLAQKIKDLIKDIMQNPFNGIGKPEPLKYELTGCWSRRINQQHRLVYRIDDDELHIISCRFHY